MVAPDAAHSRLDADIMSAIAAGDRDSLALLYDRYASLMMAVGVRILGNQREAEDLLHDVFIEVWRRAGDYDSGRGSVRAWLMVRTRSRALDRRKTPRYSRTVALETSNVEQIAPDDPRVERDRAKVREVLQTLPQEQREVLELSYFAGLSSSEIAERMGTPIGTVKSRAAAALARLRTVLATPIAGPKRGSV